MTIVDRVVAALDAQSVVMLSAVIKAGEDHFAAHATEQAAVDYLNLLESLAIAANNVGPATAGEIKSRVRVHGIVLGLEKVLIRIP
ncbi:hypothetical protein ACFSQT_14245 [Mesorhizobium calcicola]|uniref:Uncharacterized protein n=1 Tax=Mesorhizobium calcicola TaxID=1300310 RepID=A0ABW4WFN4_9HYPH